VANIKGTVWAGKINQVLQ